MRNISIVIAITSIVFSYNFMQKNSVIEKPAALELQSEVTSIVAPLGELDQQATVLQGNHQNKHDQVQRPQLQKARLNKPLADLDTRIRSLESNMDSIVSNTADEEEVSNPSKTVANLQVSEADIGQWINETLRVGNLDQNTTQEIADQAEESLEKVPGVYLEEIQCSDRFCRANITHEDGKQEAILDLFGSPPFENEGFTVIEPDGHVALYFSLPGGSLEDIRSEAKDVLLSAD